MAIAEGILREDCFETFTEWEEKEEPVLKWLGRHFAHGTGGIPIGILDKNQLKSDQYSVDGRTILEVDDYLNRMTEIPGITVFFLWSLPSFLVVLKENQRPKKELLMKTKQLSLLSAVLLTSVAAFTLTGCQSNGQQEQLRPKTVAIATLMTHPALDAVDKGMRDELAKLGYKDGKNIRFVTRNANGQTMLATGIARELASLKPDVVVAITTPIAQAVAKTPFRPIVFAAVY